MNPWELFFSNRPSAINRESMIRNLGSTLRAERKAWAGDGVPSAMPTRQRQRKEWRKSNRLPKSERRNRKEVKS